jgi:hypothetical protein
LGIYADETKESLAPAKTTKAFVPGARFKDFVRPEWFESSVKIEPMA